jgi:hypothetical protein
VHIVDCVLLLVLFQVRPQCIAGMHCLLGMVQGYVSTPAAGRNTTPSSSSSSSGAGQQAPAASQGGGAGPASQPAATKPSADVVLLRQMDQYQLFPSAAQLHLVDKKFGGAAALCVVGGCLQGTCPILSGHQHPGMPTHG